MMSEEAFTVYKILILHTISVLKLQGNFPFIFGRKPEERCLHIGLLNVQAPL